MTLAVTSCLIKPFLLLQAGYRASKSVVSGMMYAKDLTVTVLYSSRGIIIVDNFDVSRGASSQSLTCGDCVE